MKNLPSLLFCVVIFGSAQTVAAEPKEPAEIVLSESTKKALSRASATLIERADGRTELVLNGGHRHVMMSRIGEDGTIETFCAGTEEQARRFFSGAEMVEKTP